jgi:leucyl-tRNA synthetase
MSKSKYNVVNPDDIADAYGADTLRLYEMFLGPLEQSKPWGTQGIEGVHRFLGKFWRLFVDESSGKTTLTAGTKPSPDAFKVLHTCIDKVHKDIENLSLNTAVSAFMICVTELGKLKEKNPQVLEPLVVLLSPFAPHIAEEIWQLLGKKESVCLQPYPVADQKYLAEDSKTYPVSFNGKTRFTLDLPVDCNKADGEEAVLADERTKKYLEGKTVRKLIFVPGKIINFVVS